jgi:hypothetical protein
MLMVLYKIRQTAHWYKIQGSWKTTLAVLPPRFFIKKIANIDPETSLHFWRTQKHWCSIILSSSSQPSFAYSEWNKVLNFRRHKWGIKNFLRILNLKLDLLLKAQNFVQLFVQPPSHVSWEPLFHFAHSNHAIKNLAEHTKCEHQ